MPQSAGHDEAVDEMNVIIPAAGRGIRLKGTYKPNIQLGPKGETIIHRHVRLLKGEKINDILVAFSDYDQPLQSGADQRHVTYRNGVLNTILQMSVHFTEDTLILLGDLVFKRDTLREILRFPKSRFASYFFTNPASKLLEIAGLRFNSEGGHQFRDWLLVNQYKIETDKYIDLKKLHHIPTSFYTANHHIRGWIMDVDDYDQLKYLLNSVKRRIIR